MAGDTRNTAQSIISIVFRSHLISLNEAACIPETAFTVFYNLFMIGRLKEGDKVLIHGGSGGIGSTAIQMASLAGAGTVIATAGSDEKCEYCKSNGADYAYNYRKESFFEEIKQSTIGKIDIVLDVLGGEFFEKNISLLGYNGRHLTIAYLTGKDVKLDLGKINDQTNFCYGFNTKAPKLGC